MRTVVQVLALCLFVLAVCVFAQDEKRFGGDPSFVFSNGDDWCKGKTHPISIGSNGEIRDQCDNSLIAKVWEDDVVTGDPAKALLFIARAINKISERKEDGR